MRFGTSVVVALLCAAAAGCQQSARTAAAREAANIPLPEAPHPSPGLIVGRVIAVDEQRRFAFVELVSDAPREALNDGTELIARTLALQETARLRASQQLRSRTLGTTILTGKPTPGDEVVWLAP